MGLITKVGCEMVVVRYTGVFGFSFSPLYRTIFSSVCRATKKICYWRLRLSKAWASPTSCATSRTQTNGRRHLLWGHIQCWGHIFLDPQIRIANRLIVQSTLTAHVDNVDIIHLFQHHHVFRWSFQSRPTKSRSGRGSW